MRLQQKICDIYIYTLKTGFSWAVKSEAVLDEIWKISVIPRHFNVNIILIWRHLCTFFITIRLGTPQMLFLVLYKHISAISCIFTQYASDNWNYVITAIINYPREYWRLVRLQSSLGAWEHSLWKWHTPPFLRSTIYIGFQKFMDYERCFLPRIHWGIQDQQRMICVLHFRQLPLRERRLDGEPWRLHSNSCFLF